MPRSGDSLRVLIAGSSFERWFTAELDADIFTPADAWQVTATNPSAELLGVFREGQRVEVYIGDDRQLAGVIDETTLQGNKERDLLTVTGRDLGAHLLDSESPRIRAQRYTLITLAKKLLDPAWGVRNVLTSFAKDRKLALGKKDRSTKAATSRRSSLFSDPARPITKLDAGQRVAQILDERTRQLGCSWWLTAGGDLFIGKPDYHQEVSYRFAVGAGHRDVLEWEVVRSMSERYSEITVVGQGGAASGARSPRAKVSAAKFSATVQDPELVSRGFKRTLMLVDNDAQSQADVQRRAEYEMGMRRLRGFTIRLTVPGFRQGQRLFAIDTLAEITIPAAGIRGTFYVTQRRFKESRGEARTTLTLHQPGVWLA